MKPELLAPAGSLEALQAAIAAGADAIYLGAQRHGARASAGFDDATLKEAIHLAHLHGRRVYVTVNTLVKQQELPDVLSLLERLVEMRADAVIVQDLGLIQLIHQHFPHLCIHASTQMSAHNAQAAQLLQRLGVARVVLARECSLADIRAVADTGIETEVFVHGAQCVSISGQCLFSAQIGGRSGNRGRCAQPCRLQYRYKEKAGALLSMMDMNTLEGLPQLLAAGACSLKIEGRLKRPEYVYLVTSIYRKALDRALQGLPAGDTQEDQAQLQQIFSRGFTPGHAFEAQDAKLINPLRVSHQGTPLGRLLSVQAREGFYLAQARLDAPLHDGDGLQLRGFRDQDLIYSGPTVPAGQTATLRLRAEARPQTPLFRLQDEQQLAAARKAYSKLPPLPFDAEIFVQPGQASRLLVSCRGVQAEARGQAAEPAQKQALDIESARQQVGKTGATPFVLADFKFHNDQPAFMPASALNALRREALQQLEYALAAAHSLPAAAQPQQLPQPKVFTPSSPKLYALVKADANRAGLLAASVDQLIFTLDNYRTGELEKELASLQSGDILLLPRQISSAGLSRVLALAQQHGLLIMADNLGQLGASPAVSFSGEGIPAWNAQALELLSRLGIRRALLSRELSLNEIAALPQDIVELVLPVYGRAQLMQLSHCPERLRRGLSGKKAGCRLCAQGQGVKEQVLTDRLDASYLLSPTHFDQNCLIALHHHTCLDLYNLAPQMSWLLDLRLLGPEDALAVTQRYAALQQGYAPDTKIKPEPGRMMLGVE